MPALRRLLATGVEVTTRIAIAPVFVDDAGRRRRLLIRIGYLAATACIAYLVVVAISLTAHPLGPLAGPGQHARPGRRRPRAGVRA